MRIKVTVLADGIFVVALADVFAQPTITKQPTDLSVSLGANATFQVSATTDVGPLAFQWRFNSADILSATNRILSVTNVHPANAGDYTAVLSNSLGSITSQVAHLEVDDTFTKITTGQIVNDGGYRFGCAWGDYNNDGFIDLYVCNWPESSGVQHDFLY